VTTPVTALRKLPGGKEQQEVIRGARDAVGRCVKHVSRRGVHVWHRVPHEATCQVGECLQNSKIKEQVQRLPLLEKLSRFPEEQTESLRIGGLCMML
jgi:hypothetical protein